jgi:hypothetical protein
MRAASKEVGEETGASISRRKTIEIKKMLLCKPPKESRAMAARNMLITNNL